jgi:hypothetical protein
MIKIKFSHRYDKFPRDFQLSNLLDVIPVKLEDLSMDFILYDTSYTEGMENKLYSLPKRGDYMILMLQAGSGNGRLWTTIRSQKGKGGIDKLDYYKSHIGEVVECIINDH